ncbi:hypothetical protein XELAEV_18012157mg [Xenopus laevis]|uniref:Uncharacterized protein n=1 Tax=Xenopus laevis TaxID=8355 RepID=A0A974DNK2_XENLA|nr:hypothetical protein XELAEV_18012157mg [Xenopus laevis]
MAEAPARTPSPDRSSSVSPVPSTQPDIHELLALLPTKADLQDMASTVKASQKAELAGIKDTLREIGEKLGEMEAQTIANSAAIKRTVERSNDHHKHIYFLRRQLEDLENRGRCNNIRVRGVPETVTAGQITFSNQKIEVYQDLAWITLQQRRALRPLTKTLQEKGVKYRWGYPFALVAHKDGRSYTLREPDDLHQFCNDLGLPVLEIEDWKQLIYNGDDLPVPRMQEWESPSKRHRANNNRTKT